MSRPSGFADLAGLDVGVFGLGVEGEATRRRLGNTPRSVVFVDDVADESRDVIATSDGGFERLLACQVVLKSPGIPRRRSDVVALEDHGVIVTSALNLWLSETNREHVIAVTGTKGKSTTTSLITFMLGVLGEEAHSAGNIGVAPYDPNNSPRGWTVLEVSSFQSVDLEVAPGIVVVTSLGSDHLDWHGSLRQYHVDKLSFTRAEGPHVTLLADNVALRDVRDLVGGEVIYVPALAPDTVTAFGLLGRHNASNIALALAATAHALRTDVASITDTVFASASLFRPLEGRLTLVRQIDAIRFVDDGLATSALPTIAALEVFRDDPVALIVGGYDRGVDYTSLALALARRRARTVLVTMPDVGERIGRSVSEHVRISQIAVSDMTEAVSAARDALDDSGGVVLLSPAAPSFGRYENWRERSRDFTSVVNDLVGARGREGDS